MAKSKEHRRRLAFMRKMAKAIEGTKKHLLGQTLVLGGVPITGEELVEQFQQARDSCVAVIEAEAKLAAAQAKVDALFERPRDLAAELLAGLPSEFGAKKILSDDSGRSPVGPRTPRRRATTARSSVSRHATKQLRNLGRSSH